MVPQHRGGTGRSGDCGSQLPGYEGGRIAFPLAWESVACHAYFGQPSTLRDSPSRLAVHPFALSVKVQ